MDKKIKVQLSGSDGNVFAIIGKVQKALKNAGYGPEAKAMFARINKEAQSYDQALNIIQEYVDVA